MKIVEFSLEQGNKYFGKIDGTRFFIGSRVPYEGGKGLMNLTGTPAQKYNRADFRSTHGFWADFIHPTAMAEGALYHTLNTYDRAHFTFSFLQYAAHVPNGAFIAYFRALIKLPLASEYLPYLFLWGNMDLMGSKISFACSSRTSAIKVAPRVPLSYQHCAVLSLWNHYWRWENQSTMSEWLSCVGRLRNSLLKVRLELITTARQKKTLSQSRRIGASW